LEWKVVYVGNPEDSKGDQVLEEVMVGPVSVGINRFVLQADAPNPQIINNCDLIGVTVILISCSYLDRKFVQIGYYLNNEYAIPFEPENYPNPVDINQMYRNILSDEPRVTRYPIDWTGNSDLVTEALDEQDQEQINFAAQQQQNDEVTSLSVLVFFCFSFSLLVVCSTFSSSFS
jgi:histone chaperone ASF1